VLDIVLRDMDCYDMDGYEVLRRLKADSVTRDIPVILETAADLDDGHWQRGLDGDAAAYFAEPSDPQALVAAVRGALCDGASPNQPA